MASSFDALPPEIVQKCVEFLDFDLVSGDLKGVSKATRGVARQLQLLITPTGGPDASFWACLAWGHTA